MSRAAGIGLFVFFQSLYALTSSGNAFRVPDEFEVYFQTEHLIDAGDLSVPQAEEIRQPVVVDGKVVGAGELAAGKVDISLLPFTSVGTKSIEIRYFGDDSTKPATQTASIDVVKAVPTLKVKAPKKVVKGTKAKIVVTLSATGFTPTGTVTVKVKGKTVTKTLTNGVATIKVRLAKLGKNKVTINYSGDALTEAASKTRIIRVVRP